MGLGSSLLAALAAPLLHVVDARVRERVTDLVARLNTVDPSELAEVARRVDGTHRALTELRAELEACRSAMDGLSSPSSDDATALRVAGLEARDLELDARLKALQAGVSRMGDDILAVRSSLDSAEAQVDRGTRTSKAAVKATQALKVATITPMPAATGCKVPGCTGSHRARGYCGKHYQMWKRGSLAEG